MKGPRPDAEFNASELFPIMFFARDETDRPINRPVSPLTVIARNAMVKPRYGPRKAPHIAPKRQDGTGRKMSDANVTNKMAAMARVFP